MAERRREPAAARQAGAGRSGAASRRGESGVKVRRSRGVPVAITASLGVDVSTGRMTRLRRSVQAAARRLGVRAGEIAIRIVDDVEMAALHRRYGGEAGTTDVLTFDRSQGRGERGRVDVDIAVCIDQAVREVGVRCHSTDDELLLYIIHGLLHCLDHDDHSVRAAAAMHREEDRVLRAIGARVRFAESADRVGTGRRHRR